MTTLAPSTADIILAPETTDHAPAIEALLDAAFGSNRHAKISYRYRQGVAPVADLGLVALKTDMQGGQPALVGTIRFWPLTVGESRAPALLLGPIAIAPGLQGSGIGALLMQQSLAAAKAAGHRLVLLVGDLAYYQRFGFVPAAPAGFTMPGEAPHRLQMLDLAPELAPELGPVPTGLLYMADGTLPPARPFPAAA